MDYCEDEQTRHKVWVAYKRRGGAGNVRVLLKILSLRARAARLLGYSHPADFEIEIKMAEDAETVIAFYERLRPLVREKALKDRGEILAEKRRHTGDRGATVYPWDTSFYLNRLKKSKYAVDGEEIREYFPLDRVIEGLFSITQSLYGLEYRDITREARSEGEPLWHEDVRLFEVKDTATGEVLGMFYLDMHPRPDKYTHAAQWGLVQHKVWSDGAVSRPVAALVCNFPKATGDRPSLLTHDTVETFFHEFGHALHYLSSSVAYPTLNGGVRDYTEFQSQLLERWLLTDEVINGYLVHVETGEPIPASLVAKIKKAATFNTGFGQTEYVASALVDMKYHTMDPTGLDADPFERQALAELNMPNAIPMRHRSPHFGHLFSGEGYSAAYYGYMWADVLTSDAAEAFAEAPGGFYDKQLAKKLVDHLFAVRNAVDHADAYRAFRGRDAEIGALMRDRGFPER